MKKNIHLLLLLLACPLGAQTPYLVKDINSTLSLDTESSAPTTFIAQGGTIYFTADLDGSGRELWRTDGTSGGTSMVADIIPGSSSSNPGPMLTVNGVPLFSARDVNHGIELWTTDGTAAGTRLFLDLNPGPSSAQVGSRILYQNAMLMSADNGANGRELWITDGTVAGTRMVKDINPGTASSSPTYFARLGDDVYFTATGGLWKTNGTEGGTVKVMSLASLRNIVAVGSRLFFEAYSAETGWELWISDGSEAGTRLVTEIVPGTRGGLDSGYYALGLTRFGDRILFLANDGVHGRELWISDGTASGTRMVRDLLPGAVGPWDQGYAYLTVFANRAYFIAADAAHGLELWVTDGTESGTELFADLTPGPQSSYPSNFIVSGAKLFFSADTRRNYGQSLWVTDGTVAGTRAINHAGQQVGYVGLGTSIDGKLYFCGETLLNGREPWVSDGTDAGTRMIANLAADATPSSTPHKLTAAGDLLFFHATEGVFAPSNIAETSMWRTDGTSGGTYKLRESGQHPWDFEPAGPLVFFKAPGDNRFEFMVSDGTLAGTKLADDFMKRFGESEYFEFERFFSFPDDVFARVSKFFDAKLWKTSTAPNGSAIELGSIDPFGMIEFGGHYAFYAQGPGGLYTFGLWTTDGTPAGTYAIVPQIGENPGYNAGNLANAAGTLFFLIVRDGKLQLWKSDGTVDGTTAVKELPLTLFQSMELEAAGTKVFFATADALWVSDGTEAGTIELTKVKLEHDVDQLKAIGRRIVFTRDDLPAGPELWVSDGTVAGTKRLAAFGGRSYDGFASVDGVVYFNGTDAAHGDEVWTTDGTAEGTKLFADLNPGPASADPSEFTKAGNTLYFTAYTDATGGELWALPLNDPRLSINDTRGHEGDAATSVVRFHVTLTPAAQQTVTVQYTTSDGTATAAQDYDAGSGTLTFLPGETTKTIDVRVRGDVLSEQNETFFIQLRNASGARISREEGFGLVEDDDHIADIGLVSQMIENVEGSDIDDSIRVSNKGPNIATNIVVKVTSTPSYHGQRCRTCVVPQLGAGTSAVTSYDYATPFEQIYLSASAAARQRDPQSADNAISWTLNYSRTMAMNAAFLTPGATATVIARIYQTTLAVAAANPSVVSVPATATKVNDRFAKFTVTALQPGTSLVNLQGQQYPLLVTVVAPGTQPRWPGGVAISTDFTATNFDRPLMVEVKPEGTAPFSGATATGTIIVTTTGGKELARSSIGGETTTRVPVYLPILGPNALLVAYSGDSNFLPQTYERSVYANKGNAGLLATLHTVPGVPGTYSLTVRATGSPVAAPTGALSVMNGTSEVARLTLAPAGSGTSSAQTTITALPPSGTLTIHYSGDFFYLSGSQQVRLAPSRSRGVRH